MFVAFTLRAGGTIHIRKDAVVSVYPDESGCTIRLRGLGDLFYSVNESAEAVISQLS